MLATTMSNYLHEAVNFSVWNPLERLFPPIGVDPQRYQGRVASRNGDDPYALSSLPMQSDLASRLDAIIVLLFVLLIFMFNSNRGGGR